MRKIIGADIQEPEQGGTAFYLITEDELKDYFGDENIVMKYLVDTKGFDAFNTDDMYGSIFIDSDEFVLCVTDGYDIRVGTELVDPETALEDYDISELDEYLKVPTDEIFRRYFSEYELNPVDIDEVALELLQAGHHLSTIVADAKDLDLLDD